MHPLADRACSSCRQIITDDPSGLCLDCQQGVASIRPGTITEAQRTALIGLLMDQGLIGEGKHKARAEVIAQAVAGWKWGGDLGILSQQDAGDLLEHLEQRRLSQEARGT
jgi:hypothetical protein